MMSAIYRPAAIAAFLFLALLINPVSEYAIRSVWGSTASGPTPPSNAAVAVAPLPGSGDGKIHIIPALSPPSVKDGQKLTVQAVVKAAAGVREVSADLGGVERIVLRPDAKLGAANSDGTIGAYSAEWTARGLEKKSYPVVIRVTDKTGHVFEDRSLSFSDPIAGNSAVGSPIYPNGGMRWVSEAGREELIYCGVVDAGRGYAYLGTFTTPGRVVKVALGYGAQIPKRVAAITLEKDEDYLISAVIDTARGYACFGTGTSPGRVVKMALGAGDAPPARVGAVMLDAGEDMPRSAVLDAGNNYACFGTLTVPGRVVKVRLNDGNTSPSRVGAITLNTGEDFLRCAVIDEIQGYAWFGTGTTAGRVVKVMLGAGADPPARVGAVTLDAGEDYPDCAVIDTANALMCFGTSTAPGRIVKVQCGGYGAPPARVSAMTLLPTESFLESAIIDPANNLAWFGTGGFSPLTGASVVKVMLTPGVLPPVRLGSVILSNDENNARCAMIDTAHDYAYFGTLGIPAQVVMVGLGTDGVPFNRVGALTLNALNMTDENFLCAAIDTVHGYAYFGTDTLPGKVVKVSLGGAGAVPRRAGACIFQNDEDFLSCAVIDPAAGFAWFGTGTIPGRVIKVELGAGDAPPSRVSALELNADEDFPRCGVIDTTNHYAYFATYTQPGRVVKVNLAGAAPTRTGACAFNTTEDFPACGVIDPSSGYAWFGTSTSPGQVVKVALGAGAAPPSRTGVVTLDPGEDNLRCAVLNKGLNSILFGANTLPGTVIKVGTGEGGVPFWKLGVTWFPSGEDFVVSAATDDSPFAYFGTNTSPGKIVKVSFEPDFQQPVREGSITLGPGENLLFTALADPATGQAWFGTYTVPGNIHRVGPHEKGWVKGSLMLMPQAGTVDDVFFYTHASTGKVRLAIYDMTNNPLRWQSAPLDMTVPNAWVTVPISSGAPSHIVLAPGLYWLAWQTDTTASAPSYTKGAATGFGFCMPWNFGDFPIAAPLNQVFFTDEVWSQYISYDTDLMYDWRDDIFTTGAIAPPGSASGWSSFGFNSALGWPDYDPARQAYQGYVPADPTHYRAAGVIANWAEWMPYSFVGSDNYVRVKYYIYAALQQNPSDGNEIPNMRLRAQTRFAVNSMLEVFSHTNDLSPDQRAMDQELRPSTIPSAPSLYRVDFDPVDVPYLRDNAAVEGIQRAFEVYAIYPQDNGILAMTESCIGVYPSWALPNFISPSKIYEPSTTDAGTLRVMNYSELDIANYIPGVSEGVFAARDPAPPPGTLPAYSESNLGIVFDASSVPNDRVGVINREFTPAMTFPEAVRVDEGRQYKIRWHMVSTQQTNQQSQIRLRARSVKFAWSQKYEIGGAWATGGSTLNPNNAIAQQALPGVGCQNPDQTIFGEPGGWYSLIIHTPMCVDIRPDFPPGTPLLTRMPYICVQPGPGVNAASKRDLRVGCDIIDTLSGGTMRDLEKGNYTLDRIEVRVYNTAPD
ncbi:MAG: hypothetical protein WCK47_05660 [bacterium]|nr:hypothetical protein [Candidatus Sumerlaeota bacterium]